MKGSMMSRIMTISAVGSFLQKPHATLAALTRTESRGGHTRDDFPTPDDDYWGQMLNIISLENGKLTIRQEEKEEMRDDLKQVIKEIKDLIKERAAEQGGN